MEIGLVEKIVNKQFEMIGVDFSFKQIPENGIITIKTKKKEIEIPWYEYYKFTSESQYKEWEEWMKKTLKENGMENEILDCILLYSLNYPLLKQDDQLSIF